jgi:hypothetical protein
VPTQSPPPELAPLVVRLRRGELLAAGGFALALSAGIAWTRGMAGWIVIGLMAMSAATSVIAAIKIVSTVVAIRRLGEREKRGRR